ncbi:hypothetical protein [Halorubrum sp. FL23]|uniref:hypothetical protein n=1 Tax=Halorubrum sp. FL23 TaxID=3458704 RepID=UPI004033B28A
MVWELIDDYKKEYQKSNGQFNTQLLGPVLIGLSLLVVNIVTVGTAKLVLGFTEPAILLLFLINTIIVPIIAWYPLRKAGL